MRSSVVTCRERRESIPPSPESGAETPDLGGQTPRESRRRKKYGGTDGVATAMEELVERPKNAVPAENISDLPRPAYLRLVVFVDRKVWQKGVKRVRTGNI